LLHSESERDGDKEQDADKPRVSSASTLKGQEINNHQAKSAIDDMLRQTRGHGNIFSDCRVCQTAGLVSRQLVSMTALN